LITGATLKLHELPASPWEKASTEIIPETLRRPSSERRGSHTHLSNMAVPLARRHVSLDESLPLDRNVTIHSGVACWWRLG